MPPLEAAAVALALAYLCLAARENILCWPCAFVSSAIFIYIFQDAGLPMQALLYVFYALMAVVGWHRWRRGGGQGGERGEPGAWHGEWQENGGRQAGGRPGGGPQGAPLGRLSWRLHLLIGAGIACLTCVNGWVLQHYGDAGRPFLDSFITWGSIAATFMVVWKIVENWLYWIVIDSAALFLFLERGLQITALLFLVYLIIAVFGFVHWRRRYLRQQEQAAAAAGASRKYPS